MNPYLTKNTLINRTKLAQSLSFRSPVQATLRRSQVLQESSGMNWGGLGQGPYGRMGMGMGMNMGGPYGGWNGLGGPQGPWMGPMNNSLVGPMRGSLLGGPMRGSLLDGPFGGPLRGPLGRWNGIGAPGWNGHQNNQGLSLRNSNHLVSLSGRVGPHLVQQTSHVNVGPQTGCPYGYTEGKVGESCPLRAQKCPKGYTQGSLPGVKCPKGFTSQKQLQVGGQCPYGYTSGTQMPGTKCPVRSQQCPHGYTSGMTLNGVKCPKGFTSQKQLGGQCPLGYTSGTQMPGTKCPVRSQQCPHGYTSGMSLPGVKCPKGFTSQKELGGQCPYGYTSGAQMPGTKCPVRSQQCPKGYTAGMTMPGVKCPKGFTSNPVSKTTTLEEQACPLGYSKDNMPGLDGESCPLRAQKCPKGYTQGSLPGSKCPLGFVSEKDLTEQVQEVEVQEEEVEVQEEEVENVPEGKCPFGFTAEDGEKPEFTEQQEEVQQEEAQEQQVEIQDEVQE